MKKRIALLLCVAMLIGIFAGCDVDLSSIFPSTSETEPTEGATEGLWEVGDCGGREAATILQLPHLVADLQIHLWA